MTRGQTAGKRKRLRIILGVLLAAILLVCAGFAFYVGDYYRADETAVQAMATTRIRATIRSATATPTPVPERTAIRMPTAIPMSTRISRMRRSKASARGRATR